MATQVLDILMLMVTSEHVLHSRDYVSRFLSHVSLTLQDRHWKLLMLQMRTLKLKLRHLPKISSCNKADPDPSPARCHFFNNIIVLKKKFNHKMIIVVTVGAIIYIELFLVLRTKPAVKHVALWTTVMKREAALFSIVLGRMGMAKYHEFYRSREVMTSWN